MAAKYEQRSSWSDITAALGPVSTTYTGSAYQYVSSYTIPPSQTTLADSGDMYRVIVATTSPNLANTDCQFTDGISIITLDVMNCFIPLKIDLLTFNGKLVNDHGRLPGRHPAKMNPCNLKLKEVWTGSISPRSGPFPRVNDPGSGKSI